MSIRSKGPISNSLDVQLPVAYEQEFSFHIRARTGSRRRIHNGLLRKKAGFASLTHHDLGVKRINLSKAAASGAGRRWFLLKVEVVPRRTSYGFDRRRSRKCRKLQHCNITETKLKRNNCLKSETIKYRYTQYLKVTNSLKHTHTLNQYRQSARIVDLDWSPDAWHSSKTNSHRTSSPLQWITSSTGRGNRRSGL